MVICVLLARFALVAALGDRRALLAEPVALAPEAGGPQIVGEVSAAAEAFGVQTGVRLRGARPELATLPETLERLGVLTLGELASLPAPAMAERFGHPGLLALDLARGRDTPLEPRRPAEPVVERLALPEAASGPQLEHGPVLLIARLLARPELRGRSLRSLALSARFVEGGTWRTPVTLRQASADPDRLRIVLTPKLSELPAPAESIAVEVEAFGPPAREQARLLDERGSDESRQGSSGEAGGPAS